MNPSTRDFKLKVINFGLGRDFWHWNDKNLHSPFWRFYWNGESGASVSVAGDSTELLPSQVYLIPPLTVFSKSSAEPVLHLSIHFTAGPTLDAINGRLFVFPRDTGLRSLIKTLLRIVEGGGAESIEFDICTHAIVSNVLLRIPVDAYSHQSGDVRINNVCTFVHNNCEARITIETLSAMCNMSRRGLHQLFVRQIGLTPFEYVIRARIHKAGELLHDTDRTIDQIAADTGFCDRNHLTRLFTRHMGRGPAAFRKDLGR